MTVPLQASLRRRAFLKAALVSAVALPRWDWSRAAVLTGTRTVAEAFDSEVERFMSERKIPGGALAVVRRGCLVFARGYGLGDVEAGEKVTLASLFRIASLSKPITSAAILKLADQGKLFLDTPVFELLKVEPLRGAGIQDSLLRQITVRHCLHHTGGWDREKSGDPMFRSVAIANAAGVPAPAMPGSIIRHMLSQPLDFAPGSRYAYSNFGYCLLGRVIEKLSGQTYDTFVRETVLAPMGIRNMRLGRTLLPDRAAGEVKYYTPGKRESDSVFASTPGRVPAPYGGFCLEAMDSHGGWLASVTDLARFAARMDALEHSGWLKPGTRKSLYEPPAPPVSRTEEGRLADHFYGAGWLVRPVGTQGRANYWHNGSLPGTFTLMVRRFDGLSWVALFNQRSDNARLPDGALDAALHRAADAVATWPEHDLFKETNP